MSDSLITLLAALGGVLVAFMGLRHQIQKDKREHEDRIMEHFTQENTKLHDRISRLQRRVNEEIAPNLSEMGGVLRGVERILQALQERYITRRPDDE